MAMKSALCSCQFDQAMNMLNVPFYQPHKEGYLTLEDIVKLDSQVSCIIQKTRDCPRCFSDLTVMVKIQSAMDTVIRLLEAAQIAYGNRTNLEGRQTATDILNDLLGRKVASSSDVKKADQLSFGRLVLSEEDRIIVTRSLITTAIARKASVIRDLRERLGKFIRGSEHNDRPEGHYYSLSRQARDTYDELSAQMGLTSAKICSAVARGRMSK